MEDFVKEWLLDPTIGKLVAVLVGILIISALVRFCKKRGQPMNICRH